MSDVRTIIKSETGQHYVVSTVCLSFFGHRGSQLFETMVFASDGEEVTNWSDLDCARYASEGEAQYGHEKMVAKWRLTQEEA